MTFLRIGNLFINPDQITHVEEWVSQRHAPAGNGSEDIISIYMSANEAVRARFPASDYVNHTQEQVEFRFRGKARDQVLDWLDAQHVVELEHPSSLMEPRTERRRIGFFPIELPLNGPKPSDTETGQGANNE